MKLKAFALSLFVFSSVAFAGHPGNQIAGESELSMMNLSNSYNCLLKINDANSGELLASTVKVASTNTGNVNGEPMLYSLMNVVESANSGLYVRYAMSGSKKGKMNLEVLRVTGEIEDSRTPMGYWLRQMESVTTIAEFAMKGTEEKIVEVESYRMTLSCVKTKK